jgi:aminoglycoside 2'-N-acetyltransferase I
MLIEFRETAALAATERQAILALCTAAYEEEMSPYLEDIGRGIHALGSVDGVLVTHAMLVPRTLAVPGRPGLHTAYVELVATAPVLQGRGYASALLRALAPAMQDFELGALSPSDHAFYERLGWERWRGPLSVRTASGLEPSPDDEEVMILRLDRTPAWLDVHAPLSVAWRPGEVW